MKTDLPKTSKLLSNKEVHLLNFKCEIYGKNQRLLWPLGASYAFVFSVHDLFGSKSRRQCYEIVIKRYIPCAYG